jgi:Protein of unknown function (DUF2937)
MIRRSLTMFAGGVGAVVGSQMPEFAQQYQQRLGGAVEELRIIAQHFDADAARAGLDRAGGLARLEKDAESFIRDRGVSARVSFERRATLERQQRAMDAPDMLTRSLALLKDYDPMIAKGAWARFRPALPLTLEGAFAALTGFALFALIIGLLALPLDIGRKRVAPVRSS